MHKNTILLTIAFVIIYLSNCNQKPWSQMPSETIDIDRLLSKNLTPDTYLGSSGELLWANSVWNWGFADEVQVIHHTNFNALPIKIESSGVPVMVKGGIYFPSHHVLEGETDSAKSNLACNPFRTGFPQPMASSFQSERELWGPVDGKVTRQSGWSGQVSLERKVWYGVDLGHPEIVLGVVVEFLSEGTCYLPEAFYIEYETHGRWQRIPGQRFFPLQPEPGRNLISFPRLQLQKIRVVIQPPQPPHTFRLLRFHIQGVGAALPVVKEEKFITCDDVMVSLLEIMNPSWHFTQKITVQAVTGWGETIRDHLISAQKSIHEIPFYLVAGSDVLQPDGGKTLIAQFQLSPRESRSIRMAMSVSRAEADGMKKVKEWLNQIRPLHRQQQEFAGWFQQHIPFFSCSDGAIQRAYYDYWHRMKRHLYYPATALMPFTAIASERSENPDLSATFSRDALNLVRDTRWLRLPQIHQDFLRNFTMNINQTGVYPDCLAANRVRHASENICGISAAIWEGFKVHPDRIFLKAQIPWMESDVKAQQAYFTADYNFLSTEARDPGKELSSDISGKSYSTGTMKATLTQTTQIFVNLMTLADGYETLHQSEQAQTFYNLALELKPRIMARMQDEQTNYFNLQDSNRSGQSATIPFEGLYLFCFDLVNSNQLAAWDDFFASYITNRIMSVQTDLDTRSMLLKALMQSAHQFPDSSIYSGYFGDIFNDFFRIESQQQPQPQVHLPHLSEFVHDTLRHSQIPPPLDLQTGFIDLLIQGSIGLIPSTSDEGVTLHPLLSAFNWSYFALENVRYHGHDITVIWDAPDADDRFYDQREGLDVYVDKVLAGHSPEIRRIYIPLKDRN